VSKLRGRFLNSRFEPPHTDRLRIPIGGPLHGDSEVGGAAAPCELPAPTDQGRVYDPPHPLWAIAFVYAVSVALLWGARSGGEASSARLALTFGALSICLLALVHWIEGVDAAHVPAKLGAVRAPARAWWPALVAAIPAVVWCLRAWDVVARPVAMGSILSSESWGMRGLSLLLAAAWFEAFHRGFVFRALMRRHGFLVSAATSAALASGVMALSAGARGPGAIVSAAAAELPLSFALCALFWLHGQSLGPVLWVRVFVLASTWWAASAWPGLLAAAWLLVFVRRRRGLLRSTLPSATA